MTTQTTTEIERWTFDGPIDNTIIWSGPNKRVAFMTSDGPVEDRARLICAAPKMQATGAALLEALDRYGFPMSPAAWEYAELGAAVEAQALHKAAVQFRSALLEAGTPAQPTPRRRKVSGFSALRVDDVGGKEF